MRVAALVHGYPPLHNAGAEHMLHGILSEMVRRGVPCSVAISPYAGKEYDLDGVRVGGLDVLDGCDVLLTHLDRTPDAEAWGATRGVPVAPIMHNHQRPGMAKVCDLAIYNTHWIADAFSARGCSRSIVVHPPVWPDVYRVEPDGDCVTLLNLSKAKGAELFYALAEAMPDVRFLGVRGAYGVEVEPPSLPNLDIMPNQADVRHVYRRTRVVLMPSIYESYGRCAVEAAVSGIPTIANGTLGLREALGEAGTFPEKLDVRSWTAALTDVLSDWETHSAAASELAAQLDPAYDVARLIGALESLPKREPAHDRSRLSYPVKLAVECTLDGVVFPARSMVDRKTAIALKASGQLTDPRIG